ncbi:hypothetical protein EDB19DRAFT_983976 [Suillus lakei]|nr:hypothetical protein EDB19DRAFT_983976 [Suillus lakei]
MTGLPCPPIVLLMCWRLFHSPVTGRYQQAPLSSTHHQHLPLLRRTFSAPPHNTSISQNTRGYSCKMMDHRIFGGRETHKINL